MRRSSVVAAIALISCNAVVNGNGALSLARERTIQFAADSDAAQPDDSAALAEVTDGFGSPTVDLPSPQFQLSPQIDGETDSPLDCVCACECADTVGCCCESHGGWTFELGASALQSKAAVSDNEEWPDDFGPAGRIALGYEWANGFGIRAQSWGYTVKGDLGSQVPISSPFYFYDPFDYYYNVPGATNRLLYSSSFLTSLPYTRPIEINAATAFLDFSKSIYSRHGELSFGMGPAYGYLEFEFPPYGGNNNFSGGGLTLFGRGYGRVIGRNRWEIGVAGQSRFTMLAGAWDGGWSGDTADFGGTMSIVELRLGPEFRYRIGPTADRHLFLRTVAEFQQWRSDGMGPLGGDTLGLNGASLDGGIKW